MLFKRWKRTLIFRFFKPSKIFNSSISSPPICKIKILKLPTCKNKKLIYRTWRFLHLTDSGFTVSLYNRPRKRHRVYVSSFHGSCLVNVCWVNQLFGSPNIYWTKLCKSTKKKSSLSSRSNDLVEETRHKHLLMLKVHSVRVPG